MNKIEKLLQEYVDHQEIAGATVVIRKDGAIVEDFSYGYADLEKKIPVDKTTMFRIASMTKPITAIAVMQLIEQGKLGLYTPVKDIFPEYAEMKVCKERIGDEVYVPDPDSPSGRKVDSSIIDNMQYVQAKKDITIFHLLNHSSGLGMGPVGNTLVEKMIAPDDTLSERAEKYADLPLDFQPGEGSGYSGMVAFEILAAVVEKVSKERFQEYLTNHLFEQMGIKDITYELTEEQKRRMPQLYEYREDKLWDVSFTDPSWKEMNPMLNAYQSGSAGIVGSIEEYEKIAHMLLNQGEFNGVQILKPETVKMMAGEGISHDSVMRPGSYWGLGMNVKNPLPGAKTGRAKGSFGWSGAYGTHFFVDPKHNLELVLGVNRSNIGGAGSYVSLTLEKVVKEIFYPEN